MAIFKRLVQNPSSPDKDIKAAGKDRYRQSTFARLTDTNALSRDLNDQIAYTTALSTNAATVAITTKKGVIKITGSSTATITITLTNSELLLADTDKYFVQATVAHPTINAVATVVPIAADGSIAIKLTQITTTTAWTTVYLSYQIVKIGD